MVNISCSVETVSPEQAELWLESNNIENNRNIAQGRIRRYTSDILQEKWGLGQPLMFTESGTLIDGQHRLAAVVNSGVDTTFVILRGYDESAIDFIDTGKPRSTDNIARLKGTPINAAHISCYNGMFSAPGIAIRTSREMSALQKIESIERIFDAISFACEGHNSAGKPQEGRIKHSTVNAVVARAYYYENHERLTEFLEGFRTGFTTDAEGDAAVIALRNVYLGLKSSTSVSIRGTSNVNQDIFNYTQLALTHFLKKTPIRSLRLPKNPKNIWYVEEVDGPKVK